MNYDANKMQELIFFVVDNFSGMANAPITHLHRYVASVTYPFPHIFPRSVVLSQSSETFTLAACPHL